MNDREKEKKVGYYLYSHAADIKYLAQLSGGERGLAWRGHVFAFRRWWTVGQLIVPLLLVITTVCRYSDSVDISRYLHSVDISGYLHWCHQPASPGRSYIAWRQGPGRR